MNASIPGLLAYFKKKNLNGIVVAGDGYSLSDSEARAYLRYCSLHGYADLSSAPDYHEIKDKLPLQ
jgi:hypothetical protein